VVVVVHLLQGEGVVDDPWGIYVGMKGEVVVVLLVVAVLVERDWRKACSLFHQSGSLSREMRRRQR